MDDRVRAKRAAAVRASDDALVMYTSGTTGAPKGVVQGHSLHVNASDCATRLGISSDDVLLNFLPLFHCFSFNHMLLMSLVTGARHLLMEAFDAAAALRLAEREGATFTAGFDTHFRDLMVAARAAGVRPRSLPAWPARRRRWWPRSRSCVRRCRRTD
jgi:long-chain acyl-CoA synthetase